VTAGQEQGGEDGPNGDDGAGDDQGEVHAVDECRTDDLS
jgi:hypothetical protein